MSGDVFQVREFDRADENFIYASWLNTYRSHSAFARKIRKSIFYDWHHKIITQILTRPGTTVYVAHAPDASDVILGWLAVERIGGDSHHRVIHFIFVKPEFRRFGIAKTLMQEAGFSTQTKAYFSHYTFTLDGILQKLPELIYDPYRL